MTIKQMVDFWKENRLHAKDFEPLDTNQEAQAAVHAHVFMGLNTFPGPSIGGAEWTEEDYKTITSLTVLFYEMFHQGAKWKEQQIKKN